MKKLNVVCECGAPSVDQLIAHLETRTGLSGEFFKSSNVDPEVENDELEVLGDLEADRQAEEAETE